MEEEEEDDDDGDDGGEGALSALSLPLPSSMSLKKKLHFSPSCLRTVLPTTAA